MSEEKSSQSISIGGCQISNVQIAGIADRDQTVNQTQQIGICDEAPLTQADVVDLIGQLEVLFQRSGLPDMQTTIALKHLEIARQEAQAEEPDKEFVAKSLQRATTVLKEAGETVAAGTSFWQKVKPVIEALSSCFGVATGFLI